MLILLDRLWVAAFSFYPFMFVRKKDYNIYLLNHEYIHTRQQAELLFITAPAIVISSIAFEAWWVLIFSASVPSLIYWLELMVKLIWYRDFSTAYKSISFEREAYKNQHKVGYAKTRLPFSWVKYIFVRTKNNNASTTTKNIVPIK